MCLLGKKGCTYVYSCICVSKGCVQECKWADEILASCEILRDEVQSQASLAALNSEEGFVSLPFFKKNIIVFDCICSYWQQIVGCVNDKSNKSIKDISWKPGLTCYLNGFWISVWGRWRQKKKVSLDGEREWRGNEPWSEVKSKVEAHLLQSDDSKTNEAQRGSLKKPLYSFCANQELAH